MTQENREGRDLGDRYQFICKHGKPIVTTCMGCDSDADEDLGRIMAERDQWQRAAHSAEQARKEVETERDALRVECAKVAEQFRAEDRRANAAEASERRCRQVLEKWVEYRFCCSDTPSKEKLDKMLYEVEDATMELLGYKASP